MRFKSRPQKIWKFPSRQGRPVLLFANCFCGEEFCSEVGKSLPIEVGRYFLIVVFFSSLPKSFLRFPILSTYFLSSEAKTPLAREKLACFRSVAFESTFFLFLSKVCGKARGERGLPEKRGEKFLTLYILRPFLHS